MPILLSAWGILQKLPWKWIVTALAFLFVVREIERYGYHERDGEVSGLQKQIKDLKAASTQAKAINKQQVKAQEAAQTTHTEGQNNVDQIRKSAADDAVARYISMHRVSGGSASGAGALPARADAASGSNTDIAAPVVHGAEADLVAVPAADLRTCEAWVLKGESFDDWWPGAAKIINDAADAAQAAQDEAAVAPSPPR